LREASIPTYSHLLKMRRRSASSKNGNAERLKRVKNMSRMTQIKHELIRGLKWNIRFGEKKRDVKIAAHAEYLKNGGSKDGYLHPKGLFSYKSFDTYCSDVSTFARWAARNTNAKDSRSAKQYVHKYLKELIAKGRSAPTLKKYAHALARAYGCEVKDFGVELPKRRRADIKRSRNEVKSDARFKGERYERVREFARGIGARNDGLRKLQACDIRERKRGGYEVFLREKGGKERWARVLPDYEEIVLERFADARNRGENALLFERGELDHHVDVHACRAEYARMAYEQYEREGYETGRMYRCRNERYGDVYDKGVLIEVSRDLGHNRCDVVVNHYMK